MAEALISEGDARPEADSEPIAGLAMTLQRIGREAGLKADDIAIFDEVRDHSPARAVRFD